MKPTVCFRTLLIIVVVLSVRYYKFQNHPPSGLTGEKFSDILEKQLPAADLTKLIDDAINRQEEENEEKDKFFTFPDLNLKFGSHAQAFFGNELFRKFFRLPEKWTRMDFVPGAHPSSDEVSPPSDVRMIISSEPEDPWISTMMGTTHESGHALYDSFGMVGLKRDNLICESCYFDTS